MHDEIIENLSKQLPSETLRDFQSSTLHLGIFTEPYLAFMLEGKKTIESRFSKNRILPYKKISKNDIVLVKKSGGDVLAYFTIKDVLFFDLNIAPIEEIKNLYSQELCVDDSFWQAKQASNFATLIFIEKITTLKPFHITKKGMQTWIKF